jgi:hypothetical protein
MQTEQRYCWSSSHEVPALIESTVQSHEYPESVTEIGVVRGIRKVLVPVAQRPHANDYMGKRRDFELMFDESLAVNQLWIEITPPNNAIALLLDGRSADGWRPEWEHPSDHSLVFLDCEDFHRTYQDVLGRGATFLTAPVRMPFGWLSMFEDGGRRRYVLGQWGDAAISDEAEGSLVTASD